MNARLAQATAHRLLGGVRHIQANPQPPNRRASFGWGYDLRTGEGLIPTGSDGSMGVGAMLFGLSLTYLRTQDTDILTLVDRHVQHLLDLERASIAAYGSAASGTPSYWFWPGNAPFTEDYGANAGLITYQPGDPRKWTSVDQIRFVLLGLYGILVLLKPHRANLATYDSLLAYLRRLVVFEESTDASIVGVLREGISSNEVCASNLLHLATNGAEGTQLNNGITATLSNTYAGAPSSIENPYVGTQYEAWQVNNTDGQTIGTWENATLMTLTRGILSPDTTPDGVVNLLRGAANDMMVSEASLHTVTTSNPAWGSLGSYPFGTHFFCLDAGVKLRWNATEGHYMEIIDGRRDDTPGRAWQRGWVMALTALYDPTYAVQITESLTVPVMDALEATLQVCAERLVHLTGMVPFSVKNYQNGNTLNASSRDGMLQIQTPDTAYALCAIETYLLAKSGANPADYFQVPAS